MTRKEKYIKPVTEVLDMRTPLKMAGHSLYEADAKEHGFIDEEEDLNEFEEEDLPDWD